MNPLEDLETRCPYCNEPMAVRLDAAELGQWCVEDCPVCCQPVRLYAEEGAEGGIRLTVEAEN